MVHSGSASPMKTTPSASPHLPVPTTEDTTGQDLTENPAKPLTTELTSKLDLTHPSSPSPPDVTSEKTHTSNSSQTPTCSATPAATPTQLPINGRTSGRKRTRKACDCCGPNSTGHNVKTSGRGRGRGKGRGRGAGSDLGETPKRKMGSQPALIKNPDFIKEGLQQAENEDDMHKKLQSSEVVSQTPVAVAATFQHDGSLKNCVTAEKVITQKKKHMSKEVLGDVEMTSSGTLNRGALVVRGRGAGVVMAATCASKDKVEVGLKTQELDVVIIDSSAQFVGLKSQEENKVAEMKHVNMRNPWTVKPHFGNGETVNLSDSEPENESKEDNLLIGEPRNGLMSISGSASRSGTPQDLDSELQVDQIPDKTDQLSLSLTLSNGDFTTTADQDHKSTPMDMETSCPPTDSLPNHGPITVSKMQHHCALRDHRLYCYPQTWEKEDEEESSVEEHFKETDGKSQNEESLEQLTDMIHEFLETFYLKYGSFIPLSETDVLDYLKKNGYSDLSNKALDIKGTMARYRAGLASAPIAGFTVMYNKHTLSLEDLATLEEQNWVNDQIINMYGELIMEATQQKVHFFNSFFHKQLVAKGYEGVKRWTKKVDLFSKWLVLIPIHLEIHWSLVTVTMATKTISYYDSQGIVFRHTTDNIMKYLQSEAREKKQASFQKGWKITIIKGIPQQKNDSDCGVFVLEYCRCLSVKQPLLFSQEDMPRIRNRIYKELCDCHLNN